MIINKEMSYILGFLWADGTIFDKGYHHYVRLEIIEEDMKEIKDTMFSLFNWSEYNRQRKKWKKMNSLTTSKIEFYNFLVDNDYKLKSNLAPTKILLKIKECFKHYWWRGYIDGDGCFYIKSKPNSIYQFSLVSSYEQDWNFVCNLFKKLDIKFSINRRISKKGHKHSAIRITNKRGCLLLGDYIYQNYDNIGLSRKYKKYLVMKGG